MSSSETRDHKAPFANRQEATYNPFIAVRLTLLALELGPSQHDLGGLVSRGSGELETTRRQRRGGVKHVSTITLGCRPYSRSLKTAHLRSNAEPVSAVSDEVCTQEKSLKASRRAENRKAAAGRRR